jgi:hypothetical protein
VGVKGFVEVGAIKGEGELKEIVLLLATGERRIEVESGPK